MPQRNGAAASVVAGVLAFKERLETLTLDYLPLTIPLANSKRTKTPETTC
jgi:hypothetical protein